MISKYQVVIQDSNHVTTESVWCWVHTYECRKWYAFKKLCGKIGNTFQAYACRHAVLDADLTWFTVITLRLIRNLNVTLKTLNIQVEAMSILPNAWVVTESSAVICPMSIRDLFFIFRVTINEI